ncbi:MAG TPA: hypothetical protein VGV89_03400 [Thermoplasmata archaeon]|nr:hypothetical protein [Thermoplasmata archaeon]
MVRSSWFLAIVLVFLLGMPVPGALGALGSGLRPWGAPAPRAATIGNLTPSENLSSAVPGPSGTLNPGVRLGYRYQLEVLNYSPTWGSLTIWFPATQVIFVTTQGTTLVSLSGRNLTVDGPGYVGANQSGAFELISNITSFRPGAFATFSSLQLAPMSLERLDSFSVRVQWEWQIVDTDGTTTNSSWGPTAALTVHPAQYANLASLMPRDVAAGASLEACLTGPIGSRVFSLHAISVSQSVDFAQSTGTAPAQSSAPYCLSLTIPAGSAPGSDLLRVWELVGTNESLLLYSDRFHVTNGTAGAGGLSLDPTTTLNLVVLTSAVILVLACVVLIRRNRN